MLWLLFASRLLLSSLWTFYNKTIALDCITPNQIRDLHELANEVARIWKEQQEEKERQKEMENAFYVYKGKEKNIKGGSDEEEEMENIANLFPDFTDDFQDLTESNTFESATPVAAQSSSNINPAAANDVDILESDDVDFFLKVHSLAFANIRNHCLKSNGSQAPFEFTSSFESM